MHPVLTALVLLATPAGGSRAAAKAPLSEEEKAFCENEIEILERRSKVFEAQGLSAGEITRRNRSQLADLAECHDRFLASSRRDQEAKDDAEEAARRAGPDATPLERSKAYAEVRRARLSSKRPSSLSPEEKAELEAGRAEGDAETRSMRDTVHSRDPSFMRVVHSALACYHGERREQLLDLISSEENLITLGAGDKQTLYALRNDLQNSDAVLARCREAAKAYSGGLERCTTSSIALLASCMGIMLSGKPPQPACEPEEIQKYLRLVR